MDQGVVSACGPRASQRAGLWYPS